MLKWFSLSKKKEIKIIFIFGINVIYFLEVDYFSCGTTKTTPWTGCPTANKEDWCKNYNESKNSVTGHEWLRTVEGVATLEGLLFWIKPQHTVTHILFITDRGNSTRKINFITIKTQPQIKQSNIWIHTHCTSVCWHWKFYMGSDKKCCTKNYNQLQ